MSFFTKYFFSIDSYSLIYRYQTYLHTLDIAPTSILTQTYIRITKYKPINTNSGSKKCKLFYENVCVHLYARTGVSNTHRLHPAPTASSCVKPNSDAQLRHRKVCQSSDLVLGGCSSSQIQQQYTYSYPIVSTIIHKYIHINVYWRILDYTHMQQRTHTHIIILHT